MYVQGGERLSGTNLETELGGSSGGGKSSCVVLSHLVGDPRGEFLVRPFDQVAKSRNETEQLTHRSHRHCVFSNPLCDCARQLQPTI